MEAARCCGSGPKKPVESRRRRKRILLQLTSKNTYFLTTGEHLKNCIFILKNNLRQIR